MSAASGHADGQADGLDAIVPATVTSALVHARRQLLASDDGSAWDLWQHVYTSVLGGWLEDDLPELAADLLSSGRVVEYYGEATRYLGSMREVERIWNALSPHVRSLLRCQTNVEFAVSIIESVVRADGTPEDEISAWASRVWEMVKRRGLRHRRHQTQHYNRALVSHGTSALIERIRSDTHARKTCFVIGRQNLPAPLRSMTKERQCLAIRLPEERLQVVDDLVSSDGVTCFFSEYRGAEDVVRLELQVNPAFWCKYDQLWDLLFRFRRAIPVLYVFDTQCILVIYPFSHFSNLKEIASVRHKNRHSLSIIEGPCVDIRCRKLRQQASGRYATETGNGRAGLRHIRAPLWQRVEGSIHRPESGLLPHRFRANCLRHVRKPSSGLEIGCFSGVKSGPAGSTSHPFPLPIAGCVCNSVRSSG